MSYEYKHSPDSKILIRTAKGKVSFSEVLASWDDLVRNKKLDPPVMGVLNDFTYAEIMMDRDTLDQLMVYFQSHPKIFERIKMAVVMILPENIVLPVLASQNYPQFKIRAFSTVPAAEKWLRLND
jgi:hypothetical protein